MGLSLSTAGQHAGENAAQIMSQAIDNLSMYLSNTGQNIRNHPLTPLFVLLIGFLILFINLKLFLFIIRDPIGLPVFIAIIAIILYYWWNKVETRKWEQEGKTIAGGSGQGNNLNQLYHPHGLYMDTNKILHIADMKNHRIVEYKLNSDKGQVVAGGTRNGIDQLSFATDVIFDQATDSLIIADRGNRRVLQKPYRRDKGEAIIIIKNIACYGLAIDHERYLYVSDTENHRVQRYCFGLTGEVTVAGDNKQGDGLNQLNFPLYLYIDRNQSLYVSDTENHRIVKWMKAAKEGIIVAGGHGKGDNLNQLSHPQGIFVDQSGAVYVADGDNHRVVCWQPNAKQGEIVVGGRGPGANSNQLNKPADLSLDSDSNLYVVDYKNNRVQLFTVIK